MKTPTTGKNISNFGNYFKKESVSQMIADNPQAAFLDEVSGSLKKGGTITVRGQMNNRFFKDIWTGKAEGLKDFEIVKGSRKEGLSTDGYFMSDGKTPLRGEANSMKELILKKK